MKPVSEWFTETDRQRFRAVLVSALMTRHQRHQAIRRGEVVCRATHDQVACSRCGATV